MSAIRKIWIFFDLAIINVLFIVVSITIIGVCIFVEYKFSIKELEILIFNAWWFKFFIALMILKLISNSIKYIFFKKSNFILAIVYIALLFIVVGNSTNRYLGNKSYVVVNKDESINYIISSNLYLKARVFLNDINKTIKQEITISKILDTKFAKKTLLRDIPIELSYISNTINSSYKIIEDENSSAILDLAIASNELSSDIFLKENESINLDGKIISFDANIKGYINFYIKNNVLYIQSKENISTLEVTQNVINLLPKNKKHIFKPKMLYKIGSFSLALKSFYNKGDIKISTNDKHTNMQTLTILSKINNKEHISTLIYRQNTKPFVKSFTLDGVRINLSYQKIKTPLAFSIYLKDVHFVENTDIHKKSIYESKIILQDGNSSVKTEKSIFLYDYIKYKNYKIYQFVANNNKQNITLLLVKDYYGDMISYFGYILLVISFILNLFSTKNRFISLYKRLHIL